MLRKLQSAFRKSIVVKLAGINSLILLSAFVSVGTIVSVVNHFIAVSKEKQIMEIYLESAVNAVDNKLKDMARVSLMAFSDQRAQDILQHIESYTSAEKLSATAYLRNLYNNLILFRNDIKGVYLFNENQLVFHHNFLNYVIKAGYNMKGFIRRMEEIETQPAFGTIAYRMISDFEPDFLRYSLSYTLSETYCIYIIREIKAFTPYTRIGHILLTMPVSSLEEPLTQFGDSNFSYFLVHPDGSIIYNDDETALGQKIAALEPQINAGLAADSGFFTGIYRGQKSMISYKKSDYSGIILITATPLTFIYRNIYLFLTVLIAVFIAGVCIVIILSWRYTKAIIKPIHLLSAVMTNFSKENIQVQLPVTREDEAGKITAAFNTMTQKISDLIISEHESAIKLTTAELRQKETQLQYLRSQINPHFLYNTLDNIRIKAALNNDTGVADMIMLLVEFFRGNMEQTSQTVPIAHELNLIEIYLHLMQYRYPNLQMEFNLDESLKDKEIPSMILQPIVENSLLHGLKSVNYKGKITISLHRDEIQKDIIRITISDNGKGVGKETREKLEKSFTEAEIDKQQGHIGISNIQQRLRMFYPNEECGLFFEDNPEGGLCVVIKIRN